jgi:hypothetical protein
MTAADAGKRAWRLTASASVHVPQSTPATSTITSGRLPVVRP